MAKRLEGTVVSTKMSKTVVVEVERAFRHHLYKKIIRKHKNYKAHNETLELAEGDKVIISETLPLSKDKRFKVVSKLDK